MCGSHHSQTFVNFYSLHSNYKDPVMLLHDHYALTLRLVILIVRMCMCGFQLYRANCDAKCSNKNVQHQSVVAVICIHHRDILTMI